MIRPMSNPVNIPQEDLDAWRNAVANLYSGLSHDSTAENLAMSTIAGLWSGKGFQNAPVDLLRIFVQALETGYLAALSDLRAGHLDALHHGCEERLDQARP